MCTEDTLSTRYQIFIHTIWLHFIGIIITELIYKELETASKCTGVFSLMIFLNILVKTENSIVSNRSIHMAHNVRNLTSYRSIDKSIFGVRELCYAAICKPTLTADTNDRH